MALPIEPRSDADPGELAFDLVYLPGQPGLNGHLDGLVTLDLAEADEQHRETLRRLLREPFRTLIGCLRHETGHYYWHRLVAQSDHLAAFRRLFGDERADYAAAIEQHYTAAIPHWDATRFVTGYAETHPLEDWAETFAHYLHILDAVDTAEAHGLRNGWHAAGPESAGASDGATFADVLDSWRPTAQAVNSIAASLGLPPVYPFQPEGVVVEKFEFVHARVTANAHREQFYATHP